MKDDFTSVATVDGMSPRDAVTYALALYASLPASGRASVRTLLRAFDDGEQAWAFDRLGRFADMLVTEIAAARVDAAG